MTDKLRTFLHSACDGGSCHTEPGRVVQASIHAQDEHTTGIAENRPRQIARAAQSLRRRYIGIARKTVVRHDRFTDYCGCS